MEPVPVPLPAAPPGYTAYVAASLSAAGLEVDSASPERQALAPDRDNAWRWTIWPDEAGDYRVVVNLVASWEPDPDTDLGPLEEAVWSRTLTVQARTSLGLSGRQADWMGGIGSVLGGAAGLPFLERVLSVLWKRFRGPRGRGDAEKRRSPE